MTEQEMMQTWCPHAQLVERDDRTLISSGSYEGFRPHGSANCIGRRCSQWRWERTDEGRYLSNVLGYCGLAGMPER